MCTGKPRFKVLFLKGQSDWVAKPILQNEDFTHLTHMKNDLLELRTLGKQQDTPDFDKVLTHKANPLYHALLGLTEWLLIDNSSTGLTKDLEWELKLFLLVLC